MKKKIVRFFEWGDEKPGYVTTWTVGDQGQVIIGKCIPQEKARAMGYEYECPFA